MRSWLNPKLEVRPSPIEGHGLFAREPIEGGERLSRIGDDHVVMTDDQFHAYIETVETFDAVALGDGTHRVSVSARDKSPANYGNHSCDSNATTDRDGLVAARDIRVDEEVTCDYAVVSETGWTMRCNCGAPNCRRVVRGLRSSVPGASR